MATDDFIVELWSRLKPLIGAKDRLDAADAIVAVCDDYGFIDGIEDHYAEFDRELQVAVKTHFNIEEEEEEEDYYDR